MEFYDCMCWILFCFRYTSTELKYMPLNTVLYGPLLPNEPYADELSYSDQTDSEGDSDSDTSSRLVLNQ